MNVALTVDSAGRVVLPSETRRLLNLRAGSRLRLTVVAQRIELTPEPEPDEAFGLSSSQRRVMLPAGKATDAGAATRVERDAQACPRKL